MTMTELRLAELNRDIRAALSAWTQRVGTGSEIDLVVAGERMAGVLVRLQVMSDMLVADQRKVHETNGYSE